MKLRLAWLADPEYADSYSARETRVLLRAMARSGEAVPIWFAVGSAQPPHLWNGIRVFPIPPECLATPDFLRTLMAQQRPRVVLSNLPRAAFPAGFEYLGRNGVAWLERINPANAHPEVAPASCRHLLLLGHNGAHPAPPNTVFLPYLRGLDPAVADGDEPTPVLRQLEKLVAEAGAWEGASQQSRSRREEALIPVHLVMRQQLFCNASPAHVMFELTNALIELGVPTVPQDEHSVLSKGYIHREEELLRVGAPKKFERISRCLLREYDPETAITVHFTMLKPGPTYARFGAFPSLTPREVLYTTGNHTVRPDGLRQLTDLFETILAPSEHVLRPYLEAGLSPRRGAVIPHGVDPAVFSPEAPPLAYTTDKRFKFMQTSFPWVYEKGFDLTIKAFCRAFSSRDDVALILRVPRIPNRNERASTFGRLEALVAEAVAQPGAPEIVLLELDVALGRRGGIYTGADCYLFPLRAEGFGMTILEAMACGLPVIATPWSGPADFLSPRYAYTLRHSGLIPERTRAGALLRYHVEPDLDHLIHQMRYVHEHPDEAKALGRLAAAVARRDWTWARAAEKLASVFSLQPARPVRSAPLGTPPSGGSGELPPQAPRAPKTLPCENANRQHNNAPLGPRGGRRVRPSVPPCCRGCAACRESLRRPQCRRSSGNRQERAAGKRRLGPSSNHIGSAR